MNPISASQVQEMTAVVQELIGVIKQLEEQVAAGKFNGMGVSRVNPPSESPFGGS